MLLFMYLRKTLSFVSTCYSLLSASNLKQTNKLANKQIKSMFLIETYYSKSFSTGPYEVLSIDLAMNLKSLIALLTSGNITYLYFLRITAGAEH